jgi:hypothetical protein
MWLLYVTGSEAHSTPHTPQPSRHCTPRRAHSTDHRDLPALIPHPRLPKAQAGPQSTQAKTPTRAPTHTATTCPLHTTSPTLTSRESTRTSDRNAIATVIAVSAADDTHTEVAGAGKAHRLEQCGRAQRRPLRHDGITGMVPIAPQNVSTGASFSSSSCSPSSSPW